MRGTYHLCNFPLAEEQACLGGEGPTQTPWQLEAVKTNPGDWLPRFQVVFHGEILTFSESATYFLSRSYGSGFIPTHCVVKHP